MSTFQERLHSTVDIYQVKDFSFMFDSLKGLSRESLDLHQSLYGGYIKKLNEINDRLRFADYESANHNYSEIRELLIEKSNSFNAAILHELYFSNLTDQSTKPSTAFENIIERDFGSWENYIKETISAGMASRAGWALTAYNYRDGKIQTFIIDQHDLHVPVFVRPLLVMDLWEHAFVGDYGSDKKSYIQAFLSNVNWTVVSQRFEAALKTEI